MISDLGTSLLVKLYIEEAGWPIALELIERDYIEPMVSWLSEVEIAAALAARSIRSVSGVSAVQLDSAYSQFRADLSSGRYSSIQIDRATFDHARSLAERYGRQLGLRALDVLHVATGHQNGAVAFLTFDDCQGRLAEAVGLTLLH